MFFLLIALIVIVILLLVILLFGVESKKSAINKQCQAMIQRFEPDNAAPRLSVMIDYHRENKSDAVKYEV